jgi:hypothetical protein
MLLIFAKEYQVNLDLHYVEVDKEFIELCYDNNIKVNVCTADDLLTAIELVEIGVDYITSTIIE